MIDIAIIGGGPAGLTAGLYAARGGARVVLFEEMFIGGQAALTDRIENFPGFEAGIEGIELASRIEKQAVRFGLEIRYEPVTALELEGDVKKLTLLNSQEEARAIILAMGATPKKLGLEREENLVGKGISYCATCDGALFKGRDVAVVGGGDTALNDALYLSRFASKVYLIHRRDEFRGIKALQDAVLKEPKIELVLSYTVKSLNGEQRLESITVKSTKSDEEKEIETAALFVAIGISPRTELVKDKLELTSAGAIETDEFMQTSIKGVYAAGDIRKTPLRQAITAAADGAIAATMASEIR